MGETGDHHAESEEATAQVEEDDVNVTTLEEYDNAEDNENNKDNQGDYLINIIDVLGDRAGSSEPVYLAVNSSHSKGTKELDTEGDKAI